MNRKIPLPLIYHPTTVLFIDDNQAFLNTMGFALGEGTTYVLETDPIKAMDYLQQHSYKIEELSQVVSKQDFDYLTHQSGVESFNFEFGRLRGQLEKPDRYKRVVTLVVDKSMPILDGLELCRRVRERGLAVKCILLTGLSDTNEAIEAFNEGIIDAYLPKEDPLLAQKLIEYINTYTWQQFQDFTTMLTGPLSHIMRPLRDERFIDAFQEILQQQKITEFYLLDSSCSYLLVTGEGSAKIMLVRDESDFQDVFEIAKNNGAPFDVVQIIKERQGFPYTPTLGKGFTALEGDDWKEAIVPVNKIKGRDFYYALVDRPDIPVISFNHYYENIWQT